ncbi:hypothetical protein BKA93DRAFT_152101 [Sparassis latifolia]
MDKTLDEIISSHPKGIRRSSSRRINTGKSQILGSPASAPVTRARAAAAAATNGAKGATAAPTAQQPADKIIVSNLPPDVNEAQVKELFHTMIGPLREVTLHYDAQGRSKGVAAVQFQRRGDGTKAYNQYNNRLIDGTCLWLVHSLRNYTGCRNFPATRRAFLRYLFGSCCAGSSSLNVKAPPSSRGLQMKEHSKASAIRSPCVRVAVVLNHSDSWSLARVLSSPHAKSGGSDQPCVDLASWRT